MSRSIIEGTVVWGAAAYPEPLLDLRDPPQSLTFAGELPRDWRDAVAIVGTRSANDAGLSMAYALGESLARAGVIVVSGGARGIDRAAHEGALDARGVTVVVLPTSITRAVPREHAPLLERVVREGSCIVTEAAVDWKPTKWAFLRRNRIIAALARATIVVQAPVRSGALSTAAHARKMGRVVFAVPAWPSDPRGGGNLALLRRGARMCTAPADALELFAELPRFGAPSFVASRAILDAAQRRAMSMEGLAEATGIEPSKVAAEVTELLLEGRLVEVRGGSYRAVIKKT